MGTYEKLLARLIDSQVDFVIIGGFAAMAHGSTLITQDLDVACDFSVGNLHRLGVALDGLHPVHRMTPKRLPLNLTPDFSQGLRNLYLDTDLGQLDCLSEVTGIGDFTAIRRESIEIELPFGSCRLLSIDALIEAKRAMPRRKDQQAVAELVAIKERTRPLSQINPEDTTDRPTR